MGVDPEHEGNIRLTPWGCLFVMAILSLITFLVAAALAALAGGEVFASNGTGAAGTLTVSVALIAAAVSAVIAALSGVIGVLRRQQGRSPREFWREP